MKTILEWLQELPDEHRDKAIANHNAQFPIDKPTTTYDNLYDAFVRAFSFVDSPEGGEYWANVCVKCSELNTTDSPEGFTADDIRLVRISADVIKALENYNPVSIQDFASVSAMVICYIHDKKKS